MPILISGAKNGAIFGTNSWPWFGAPIGFKTILNLPEASDFVHVCFFNFLPTCDTDACVCFVLQLFLEAEDGRHVRRKYQLGTASTTTVEVT